MRRYPLLRVLPLGVILLASACGSPASDEPVSAGAPGDVTTQGNGTPVDKPPQAPSQTINLRPYPQVNVRLPGSIQVTMVAAGTNLNVPCTTSTVDFDVFTSNDGNTAAGPFSSQAFVGQNLAPFQTLSVPGLAAGAWRTDTFTRSVAASFPNVAYEHRFRADSPSVIGETNENDNQVAIRITRVCP